MECDRYPEHGQGVASSPLAWSTGFKRKLGAAGAVRLGAAGVRGAGAALLARAPPRTPPLAPPAHAAPRRRPSPRPSPRAPLPRIAQDSPFMSNMDEITFWIVTKRAPCLAGFENPSRAAAAQVPRLPSLDPEPKRKKRKLATVDDTSDTSERPIAFLKAQPECESYSSEKSDTLVSDVDFNIKKSSIQAKNKKTKNQRNNLTTLHKKNKVVTSTPKVASNLRRSLRKAHTNNNNTNLNSSLEIFNMTTANGKDFANLPGCEQNQYTDSKNLVCRVQADKRKNMPTQKLAYGTLNGQFEDLSDVSGFTANYIKSTKINSKTPRKIRAKPNRNITKESRQNMHKEEKSLIVSINKAVNTGDPKTILMNCSTDSSQNVINLVSTEKDSKSNKVDKTTSLLKFMDSKKGSKDINTKREIKNGALNASFKSTSTTGSRYPKRHQNSTEVTTLDNSEKTDPSKLSSDKIRTRINNSKSACPLGFSSENADVVSRTRSGRSIGHTKNPENSVMVFSNCTEQMSSVLTMNVAGPAQDESKDNVKKKRVSSKCSRARKSQNKTGQSSRDSFREKSGFAACFSDSDDDKPLKPQKYLS